MLSCANICLSGAELVKMTGKCPYIMRFLVTCTIVAKYIKEGLQFGDEASVS